MAAVQAPNLFGSRQDNFADIRILDVNIHGGMKYYLERHSILKQREKAISPLEVVVQGHNVHVTPLLNEIPGLHILRLTNPDDKRYRVNLFMRDEDLYFTAFSVEEIPSEEEVAGGIKAVRSPCFKFNDADNILPDFLDVEVVELSYSYGSASEFTPGGSRLAMDNMFYAFVRYSRTRRINLPFRKAVYSVMGVYCETRRLLSALTEMAERVDEQSEAKEVSDMLWEKMHCWTKLGRIALEDFAGGILALENALPYWCQKYLMLSFMSCLLGDNGEVLIIKSNKTILQEIFKLSETEFERRSNAWKVGVAHNPDFIIPGQAAGAGAP